MTPPPTPSPGPGRGGGARRQIVQDGPRWLQEGLREPKMASKTAQDSPTWLNIANNMPPRGSKTAPKRLQVAKEPSKAAPEKPKPFRYQRKLNVLVFSPFRFRWAYEASRWLTLFSNASPPLVMSRPRAKNRSSFGRTPRDLPPLCGTAWLREESHP